jgi:hypothetical protein
MMIFGVLGGFVFVIWALISLSEARSGVSRIFRELEQERQLGQAQKRQE